MEDRLSELLAKLDRMRDAQVALQERLSTAKREGGEEGDPGGAAGSEDVGAGEGDEPTAGVGGGGDGDTVTAAIPPPQGYDTLGSAQGSQSSEGATATGGRADPFCMYSMERETFLVAAENGNVEAVTKGVSQWSDDSYLMNESLYAAAANSRMHCIRILADHGADCNYWHSPTDQTVLSVSASNGHLNVMEYLVGKGVKVDQQVHGDKHTALHAAAITGQTDCAQFLVDSGCDLNAKDTFGITPLMEACKNGHVEVLKLLLEAGADPKLKSRVRKETAFMFAFDNDHAECVQELLTKCPEEGTVPLKGGLLPMHHAIRHGKDQIVCALIDAGINLNLADGPWTPIHLAVEMGNIPIVGILAACGADLNAHLPVPKKVTILMLAVCKENPEMVRAIGSQATCHLNQYDELGRTALYLASKFGYVKCVEVLLEICADVDAYAAHMLQDRITGDSTGPPPAPTSLHAAILNDHPEVATLLIAAGCTTDMGAIFEEDGASNLLTPLHVACLRKLFWAVDMLLEAGTQVPDDFTNWCRSHGLDPAIINHVENAVAAQKKNPGDLKK